MQYNNQPPPPGFPSQQPQGYPQQQPAAQPPTPPYWPQQEQTPPAQQQGNPQFSGQQGYGAPPPAQPPQQSQGYPPQQGYGAPIPPQQPPPAQPGGFVYHQADVTQDQAFMDQQEADRRRREEAARNGGGKFGRELKIPGPGGEQKWGATVPVGYEGHATIWVCPPWAEGKPTRVESQFHFVKTVSFPQGISVAHTGDDCAFCSARNGALKSPDPRIAESAANWGKVGRKTFYNVLYLDVGPEAHRDETGAFRPFVLKAGNQLQKQINHIVKQTGGPQGITAFFDPNGGIPLVITKKKTGPKPTDIEWAALPKAKQPLGNEWQPYNPFANLYDLEEQAKPPAINRTVQVLQELGWGVPPELAAQVQAQGQPQTQGYSPTPNPPAPNPYPRQPQGYAPTQQTYQQQPQGYAHQPTAPVPMTVQHPGQPPVPGNQAYPAQPPANPGDMGPPPGMPPAGMPPPPPPQVGQPQQPPPNLPAPPPVTSTGQGVPPAGGNQPPPF